MAYQPRGVATYAYRISRSYPNDLSSPSTLLLGCQRVGGGVECGGNHRNHTGHHAKIMATEKDISDVFRFLERIEEGLIELRRKTDDWARIAEQNLANKESINRAFEEIKAVRADVELLKQHRPVNELVSKTVVGAIRLALIGLLITVLSQVLPVFKSLIH